jgi:hypothetical protein
MGVASSARMFFQQIGGSIGVAAFGAVFASRLTGSLRAVADPGVHIGTGGGQLDPATVDRLPAPFRHDVFYAIAHAIQVVFVWAAPAAVLIFLGLCCSRRSRCAAGRPARAQARPPASSLSSRRNRAGRPSGHGRPIALP